MMHYFLVGDCAIHARVTGDDLETTGVKMGKLGEIINTAVYNHPISIFIIIV